ncbi:hypothetical protein CJJ07_004902 [Candidozyma auris]|nr:hypothetical protein CJJ07_004902 [[Candida] auris]QEL61267.1 hypothetical protein CJJ09_003405 [[Candida] auris]
MVSNGVRDSKGGATKSHVDQSKRRSRGSVVNYSEQTRNSKRSINGGTNDYPAKKVRTEIENSNMSDSEQKLIETITDFNICVNELFQLKEYGSLVEWNPRDFSKSLTTQVPEILEYFVEQNNYRLIWDEDSLEKMDSIPLRLQKKKMLEREEMLRSKYPFMDSVLEKSIERESQLLRPRPEKSRYRDLHKKTSTSKAPPSRKGRIDSQETPVSDVVSAENEEEEGQEDEEEEDIDYGDLNTNYKLKQIKFTVPPLKITHPSHIPSWRPSENNENDIRGGDSEREITPYDPEPLSVVTGKHATLSVPAVEEKLSAFLSQKFKAPIVDDANPDYNNTPEEYENVLDHQRHLLKRLYEKIVVEERFELNGDKIERRKIILPTFSNQKLLSDPFRDTGSIIPKIQGTSNDQTLQDHLVDQGFSFSKIHQQMRKSHQARARKVAQMVDQHFRKKRGEKERLAKEREQNLKKLSRLAIQSVKKRWSQAHKVYRHIQHEKEEEIKQREGREHLSKMLKHSTQLLEAQLNKSEDNTADEPDSDDDEQEQDSENFSSSESDSDDSESETIDKPDSECTVEELKRKYADMESSLEPSSRMETEEEIEDEVSGEGASGLAALYGGVDIKEITPAVSEDYTEEQKKLIAELSERKDEDLSDLELSDDLLSDESVSESEEDVSLSENEDQDTTSGLADLYKKGPIGKETNDSEGSTVEDEEPKTPVSEDKTEEINGLKVKDVPVPSLLRGTLRPYQKQGLNWLASLYNNDTNGILADEMGLGKTIQTIALLSYLACEHHIWGPHLIIVPTSVMLNWEMEFKRFAPGFKVLTYYGSPQERARKRKGWNKIDTFHVCITSYQLVVHDHSSFKRRKWRYMILDEAHNIKNFRSNRWKALLNFNTENRLLLTGTPLQNNLMELWSLLYFLMPSSKVDQMMPDGFANFEDFQQWFGKPVDKILEKTGTGEIIDDNVTGRLDEETKNTVARLHQVLRPYLLRRLKKDVEKQMPGKYEHIVYCRLSKRQRYLYDDFMSRAKTKETLVSGNFLSIINCLMQLRKVCNHPDLFEVRPIVTSYAIPRNVSHSFKVHDETVKKLLDVVPYDRINYSVLNLDITKMDDLNWFAADGRERLRSSAEIEKEIKYLDEIIAKGSDVLEPSYTDVFQLNKFLKLQEQIEHRERLKQILYLNNLRCSRRPLYGTSILDRLKIVYREPRCELLDEMILDIPKRAEVMKDVVEKYGVVTPSVVALDMKDEIIPVETQYALRAGVQNNAISNPFHHAQVKLFIAFPDKQLLQYDCGKLQKLAALLQDLIPKGHRALIFTQMTKVLDILEQFLNIHGHRYMRLDGATKIEDRQLLTEKFNRDPRIPVFILSTRSGGLGINLTGADTVIFYDSDWNPAMDKQCQDRCHRIGQSRDVHIYRFVSEATIESNILKKANQKRQLDNVVIQEGEFTTDYLGKFSVRDLVNDASLISELPDKPIGESANVDVLAQAEDEADRNAAREAMKEVAVDDEDFNEEKGAEDPRKGPRGLKGGNLDDADYDEGVGHIDEYMLRYIAEGYYAE